jgi:hypothetical protein
MDYLPPVQLQVGFTNQTFQPPPAQQIQTAPIHQPLRSTPQLDAQAPLVSQTLLQSEADSYWDPLPPPSSGESHPKTCNTVTRTSQHAKTGATKCKPVGLDN